MSRSSHKLSRGFTLVEMVVSLGIVSIIISTILANQSGYIESVALGNLSEEIAATIVQSQAYGIAVKELAPGSSDFSASYGLAFSRLDSGSPTSYILFADRNSNVRYDGSWACSVGGASECLGKNDISRGNYVADLCVIRSVGNDQCGNVGRIDISFKRPETEARIIFFNSSGELYDPNNMIGARIKLRSPGGLEDSVAIYQNGQVSVQ